ncbi:MAG: hypothetical protein WC695_11775 [Candidatus Omnitrophota bacterium]
MIGILSNREVAIAIYLSLFVIWSIRNAPVRSALLEVMHAFLPWKVWLPLATMAGYMMLMAFALSKAGFWDTTDAKDTLFWIVGVGAAMLFRAAKSRGSEGFFKEVVLDNLKLVAVLEFVSNAHVFPFLAELLLVPFLIFVGALKAMADIQVREKPDIKLVASLLGYVLIVASLLLIGGGVYPALQDENVFLSTHTLQDFLLPAMLSALYLPFLYGWALIVAYENVFVRVDIANNNKELSRYFKRALLVHFHMRLNALARWSRKVGFLKVQNRSEVVELIDTSAIAET